MRLQPLMPTCLRRTPDIALETEENLFALAKYHQQQNQIANQGFDVTKSRLHCSKVFPKPREYLPRCQYEEAGSFRIAMRHMQTHLQSAETAAYYIPCSLLFESNQLHLHGDIRWQSFRFYGASGGPVRKVFLVDLVHVGEIVQVCEEHL